MAILINNVFDMFSNLMEGSIDAQKVISTDVIVSVYFNPNVLHVVYFFTINCKWHLWLGQ